MIAVVAAALVLWQAPGALRVANGTAQSLRLPAMAGPARLLFRARADFPRRAGSTFLLGIRSGDREIGPMADRRMPRLVAGDARAAAHGPVPRFDAGRWRVAFAPAATEADAFALEVGDLLRADAPTILTFTSGLAGAARPTPLVIENARLERDPDAAFPVPAPPPDWRTPRLRQPPAPPYEADADATHVRVRWSGGEVVITTTVVGDAHRLARALVRHPTHLEVRDTFANDGDAVLGLRVRHALATDEPWVHLAGRAEPSLTDAYAPWNPTVFAPVGAGGAGLVAEDDVFRQQLRVDYAAAGGAPSIGLRTDMLCLAPHDTVTLTWSVYPIASRSYWDFLNTLRDDWGANRPVPGSYVWFKPDEILAMPADRLRDALARAGVAVASMSGGWIDPRDPARPPHLGFGTDVGGPRFAALRARLRDAVQRLKAARPSIRVLLYFDAQRESASDAPSRFADGLLVDAAGRPERTDWGGRFSPSWSMVPTDANGFGRALAATARTLAGLGADGLYWDEIDAVDYATPRLTATPWDGRSCILADDGTVRARVGLANLVSAPVKLAIAGAAGMVLGNGPPTMRAFQDRADLRMIEAQHNDAWGAFAHLSTPLGYVGSAGRDVATIAAKIDEGLLVAGTGLDDHPDLVTRLFPLTPQYIQPGTLRGRERIVTTESGIHGWLRPDPIAAGGVRTDTRPPAGIHAWRVAADGTVATAPWHTKRRHGASLVRVRLRRGEIGIVEREVAVDSSALTMPPRAHSIAGFRP